MEKFLVFFLNFNDINFVISIKNFLKILRQLKRLNWWESSVISGTLLISDSKPSFLNVPNFLSFIWDFSWYRIIGRHSNICVRKRNHLEIRKFILDIWAIWAPFKNSRNFQNFKWKYFMESLLSYFHSKCSSIIKISFSDFPE